LEAFHLQEECETFCGPTSPESMVDTNLDEAKTRCLRSVFETCPESDRANQLWDATMGLRHIGSGDVSLQTISDAGKDPLTELEGFLPEWIRFLQEQPQETGAYWRGGRNSLLREAVRLAAGADGLADLAEKEGVNHPEAFYEWVGVLVREGRLEEAVDAAKTGMERIGESANKASMADCLAELAARSKDIELALEARGKAWRSAPTLKRLLFLCSENSPEAEELDLRLHQQLDCLKQGQYEPGIRLTCILELLCADYESPLLRLKESNALGWSNMNHPGVVVFPFLLHAASGVDAPVAESVMEQLWKEMGSGRPGGPFEPQSVLMEYAGESPSAAPSASLETLLLSVLKRHAPSDEDRLQFLKVALSVTCKRAEGIVSNKYRGAYRRAADAAVAAAEACSLFGRREKGTALLEALDEEFRRFSAFRKELREAIESSPVLSCTTG